METLSRYFRGFGFLAVGAVVSLFVSGCMVDNHVKVLFSNETGLSQQNNFAQWHKVQEGLSYSNVLVDVEGGSRKELFLVKVDPHLFEFRIYNNSDQTSAKTLKEIHQQEGSVLTFNGAFFDEEFKAMGLLQDSKSNSHRQISSDLMNGIFKVSNKSSTPMAQIFSLQKKSQDNNSFMIQNGPILLDDQGNIPLTKDTGKLAARTAIGVDNQGNVVVITLHQSLLNTDNTLSLYQFAHMLAEKSPFVSMGLHSVLNLDGGPSTGIMVAGEYLPEISNVQNAVITLPRKEKI